MKLLNKLKIISLYLFGFGLITAFITASQAADFDITCDNSGCSSLQNAIFSITNVLPGDSIAKTLELRSTATETLNITMDTIKKDNTDDDFLNVVNVIVQEIGGPIRFNNSLAEFLDNPNIDMGSLNSGNTKQYTITLTLQNVGNQYQGKQAKFEIPINISVQGSGDSGDGDDNSAGGTGGTNDVANQTAGFTFTPITIPATGEIAGTAVQPSPDVLGESTPSADILGQLKNYLRFWPWLLAFPPFFWFLSLYWRRLRR